MTCNFITCFITFGKFIWHKKTLWINCFCNHQTIYTLSTRLMSKSLSYFKAVKFCLLHFSLKILFHFVSKSCWILRQKLLHFASKVVAFRVYVTFCGVTEAVHSFFLHICKPPYIVMLLIILFMEVSLVFQEQNFANPGFVF